METILLLLAWPLIQIRNLCDWAADQLIGDED